MKRLIQLLALSFVGGALCVADDKPATTTPKPPPQKEKVTFEYSYPPLPPEKKVRPPVTAPLPRVGSQEWLRRLTPADRDLLAPWELRRMNSYTFSEVPPTVRVGFSSTWQ